MSPKDENSRLLDEIAALLINAQRILFITGAGISADSGLPTYRGVGGLYGNELTEEGLRIEEILSGEVFARSPALTWKYLRQIEECCRSAQPNAAHHAIAALEASGIEQGGASVLVLTQNVHGLHRLAGSQNLIEIHGNLQHLRCTTCQHNEPSMSLGSRQTPPICPVCQSVLRPDVVLFGEALPEQAVDCLIDEMEQGFDLVFSIGTSSAFPYIVQPVVEALQNGVPTVEINPATTSLSKYVDYRLSMGAAQALEMLMQRVLV